MANAATGKNAAVKTHPDLGRVVVPRDVPSGFTLFYTTTDFDGRIDDRIRSVVAPAALASCHQVHGVAVQRAPLTRLFEPPSPRERGEGSRSGVPSPREAGRGWREAPGEGTCDALWSDAKNTALAIKVADCLPISVIDPDGIIANIHSGWRGTIQGITTATLDAVHLDPTRSFAFLGPSIRACCFEVGEEVAAQFHAPFVDRTHGVKPHVDIIAITTAILRQRGFANIVDTGLCTRCPGSIFHSYRRDKKSGRNLAIVAQ